jgi:hypothetical protein
MLTSKNLTTMEREFTSYPERGELWWLGSHHSYRSEIHRPQATM